MMRFILAAVLALALVGEAGAVRTIEYTDGSYEVTLNTLVLPASTFGRLSIRTTCTGCTQISLQVNATTEYVFGGGKPMSLADFRIAVEQLRQKAGAAGSGVVYYKLATKRVSRVVFSPVS
jgi:hypothetical protein